MSIKRMRLFFPSIKYDVDCDKYMGVGVESVTDSQWKQIAELNRDTGWKVTKGITERCLFDWMILVYLDNKLKKVTYFQSYSRCSGIGYKGCGMTYAEKKQIDQFFFEVEDEGHPYAFVRRSQPVIDQFVYAKPKEDTACYKSGVSVVTAKVPNGYSRVTYEDLRELPHKVQGRSVFGISACLKSDDGDDLPDLPDDEDINEEKVCSKKQKINHDELKCTSHVDLTHDDEEEMPLAEQHAIGKGREDDSE
jgi:hypothetical protein